MRALLIGGAAIVCVWIGWRLGARFRAWRWRRRYRPIHTNVSARWLHDETYRRGGDERRWK